jgi:transcriptional regulator with XRE-family HTH domain
MDPMNFSYDGLEKTPLETKLAVAKRLRERRKEHHWSMAELARRSEVSYASVKRFEEKGEIAFSSLIRLAFILDALPDFDSLFSQPHYTSIEEITHGQH